MLISENDLMPGMIGNMFSEHGPFFCVLSVKTVVFNNQFEKEITFFSFKDGRFSAIYAHLELNWHIL